MTDYPDLVHRGRTIVVVVPIEAKSFNSMAEFYDEAEKQESSLRETVVTPEAYKKYLNLIFKPEEKL